MMSNHNPTVPHINGLAFQIGEIVFSKISEERGMITGVLIRPNGVSFYVTWPDRAESLHYEFELSKEQQFNPAHN